MGQTASLPHTCSDPCPCGARQRRPTHAFAGGRLLLPSLPPSAPAAAPTETKRSAHAPCSWGMGASARSRRRWKPALPAGPLGARRPPCSCGARDCHASVENTGLPLILSSLCCFAHFFSARTCNRTAAASPFPLLRGRNRRAAGGNDAALPCGQGGAVGVRGTTLFALWAKALQSGAPDFGLSRGKVG